MRFSPVRFRHRATKGRKPPTVLAILVLGLMLLAPIAQQLAAQETLDQQEGLAAQETETPPEPTAPPEVVPTAEPVLPTEEPAVPTEIPIVPTEEPTETPTAPITLNLFMGLCGNPAFDPYAATTAQEILDTCQVSTGEADFTVSGTGDYLETKATAGSTATFQVPEGAFTVTGTMPEGHGEPVVVCSTSEEPDNVLTPVSGGSIGATLPAGGFMGCSWFNVPESGEAPADGSIFDIHSHLCPEGVSHNQDPETLAAECPLAPNVLYYLSTAGPMPNPQQMSNAAGVATWSAVPDGPWTAYQATPEGYRTELEVSCRYLAWPEDATGIDGDPFLPNIVSVGNGFEGDLGHDGLHLACDVYNFLLEGDTTEIPGTETPGQVGQIDMHVVVCPSGYTFETFDITQMADCLPGETGAVFTASDGASYTESPAGSDGSWRVFFDNVPLDQPVTITRDIGSGEGAPYATCDQGTGVLNVVPADNGIETTVETPSAGAPFERCIWFTVLSNEPAAVTVDKHTCPDGALDPQTATYEEFLAACTTPGAGVTFHVYDTNVEGPVLYDETDANGHLAWAGVAGERFSVLEEVPDGYAVPVVFCTYGSSAVPDTTWERQPTEAGDHVTSDFPLAPGYTWACHWFNVPVDPNATEVPASLGEIGLDAFACPASNVITAATIDDLLAQCTTPQEGVTLTVTDGGSFNGATTTATDGAALILDIPTDVPLVLTVDEPEGFEESILACSMGELGMVPLSLAGGEYGYTVSSTESCVWIGIPAVPDTTEVPGTAVTTQDIPEGDDSGQVLITKYACPDGFETDGLDRDALIAGCTDDAGPVEFTLASDDFSATHTTPGGTNEGFGTSNGFGSGLVPASELTVTETIPAGYGAPIAFCSVEDPVTVYKPVTRMTLENDTSVTESFEAGQFLICHWFNIVAGEDEDPTTVTVVKYACPDSFAAYDASLDELGETCTEAQEGIDFTLTYGEGSIPGTTDANGAVTWNDVPPGLAGIQEYLPDGYGEPVVYCGEAGGTPERVDVSGGYVEIELSGPSDHRCLVYNVPAGPGALVVHTWTCPPGYDLFAYGADPQADCTEPADGVTFTLDVPAGDDRQAATADGRVHFDGLAPGGYQVIEAVPAGTASSFVLDCTGQRMGELRPYPLVMGNTLGIHVSAGESITCHWYNVLANDPAFGRLTVVKYDCATVTYVSEVDCEVYEGGQGFDLVRWNGDSWEYHSTGTTDGFGRHAFASLASGAYWLDEHDRGWCHLASDRLSGDGNWLNVSGGEETIVTVYNCSNDPADQGKPGETPTKYPNTGVPPIDERRMP